MIPAVYERASVIDLGTRSPWAHPVTARGLGPSARPITISAAHVDFVRMAVEDAPLPLVQE